MKTEKLEINLLKDEYWWAGIINDGIFMPYGEEDCENSLYKLEGNQGMPLLLSSKGRYVWCDHPFTFNIEDSRLTVEYEFGSIEYGDCYRNLKEVYKYVSGKYFPPSGGYPDKEAFLVPQYNTWIEMHYNPTQEKVIEYAQTILDKHMPPGILIIDDNWMEDYGTWKFHPGRFPNPKEMIETLHKMGFKVMLWLCPYVSPDSMNFRFLNQKGWLLKNKDESPVLHKWWNGYSGVIDYISEPARVWLYEQLDLLMQEYGVDGFKFDGGKEGVYKNSYLLTRSIYPNEDCESWGRTGLRYGLAEYKSAWKTGGKHFIQRLRDKGHEWEGKEGLASLIPDGLLQGLMGYWYNCPDMIGGGLDDSFGKPDFELDQELFVRYAQCSALFPIMQFSLAPWKALDEEHFQYCMDVVRLRERLGPEILKLAQETAVSGEPITRHMAYVFPNEGYEKINDQFMLGNEILVAPVIKKGADSRVIVFPKGTWQGDDGSIVEGKCTKEVSAPLSRLPWYRRIK